MTVARPRVLVVEDNKDLALGLQVNLEDRDYEVHVAHTAGAALPILRRTRPHVIILDLSLPDGDGREFMRRMRATGDETLVLMLTATARQDVKLESLRIGADDYVTKPFDLEELLTRVDVLLRRTRQAPGNGAAAAPDRVTLGEIELDVRARSATRRGSELALSRIGFDLLVTLLRRRGSVVSRAELMREVWGYSEGVVSRTLDTHIFELRKLIEPDPAAPTIIKTVWRVGYRVD